MPAPIIGNFSVYMRNEWYLTEYEHFNQVGGMEMMEGLRVILNGDVLTIDGLKADSFDVDATITARRSLDLPQQALTAFVIVEDNLTGSATPFPALGTAVVFQEDGKWRLRAAGYDRNGTPKGWVFNATETRPT